MRRSRRIIAGFAVIAVLAGAGYAIWRPARSAPMVPPEIDLSGVDPMVAQAIRVDLDAVRASPDSASLWGHLGIVLFAHDFNAEALTCFARAAELDPADSRWHYYQGVLLASEHPAEALEPFRLAAARARQDPLPQLRLAETLYALDRLDEAETSFRAARVSNDDESRVSLGLGLIAWRRGDLKACVPLLERAANSPCARRAARAALAEAQQRLGNAAAERLQGEVARLPKDPPWPDRLLETVIDQQTGTRPRLNQVNNLLLAGRVAEALELCRQILQRDPNSAMAHLALGRAMMQARDYTAAEKELAESARRWPDSIDAHLMRGGALSSVGHFADAAKCFRRVIELSPSNALAHYNLATCLRRTGDRPGARRSFADAIRCRPDFVPAHVDLAELLLEDGDAANAVAHLRDALRLNPDDERAKKLLADAESRIKKPETLERNSR